MKIESGIKKQPEFMIIYGPSGLGKSTFASDFPGPVLFADVEHRLGHLDVKSVVIDSWDQLIEFATCCITPGKDEYAFKSIAFDTLDAIELLVRAVVAKKYGVKDFADIPDKMNFAKWEDIKSCFKTLIDLCVQIRGTGKNVVITCHSEVKSVNDPMTVSYDRHQPKVQDKPFALFRERVDDLFFVGKDISAQKKEKRGFADEKRYVFTAWNPAYDAKCSFKSVPAKFELKEEHPYQYYLALKGANKNDTLESVKAEINAWKGCLQPEDLAKITAKLESTDLVELVRVRNKLKEYMDSVIKGGK